MAHFDVRYMDSTVLQDYLIGLKCTRTPKYLISDFIKSSKTRLASELLERLFPLSDEQHDKIKSDFHRGC